MTQPQYDRQAADERTRLAMEEAAWRADHAEEARAEEIPGELAEMEGGEIFEWLAIDQGNTITRLELLLEAIAQYGAAPRGGPADVARQIVQVRVNALAESMIEKKIREDRA
jgi:hypothetical protein